MCKSFTSTFLTRPLIFCWLVSFCRCLNYGWRKKSCGYCCCLFYCDMIWNFHTCNSCGDSLQSAHQTWSECTLSLYELCVWLQRCAYHVLAVPLIKNVHLMRRTTTFIEYLSLEFSSLDERTQNSKTILKWMRPYQNEEEANVCNVFNARLLLLAHHQLVFLPNNFSQSTDWATLFYYGYFTGKNG